MLQKPSSGKIYNKERMIIDIIIVSLTFGSIFCVRSPASASPLTLSNTLCHLKDDLDILASLIVKPNGAVDETCDCLFRENEINKVDTRIVIDNYN